MPIESLSIANFRNYQDKISLSDLPSSGIILIQGENGSGKTSLLEAITTINPHRTLLKAPLKDLKNEQSDFPWKVCIKTHDHSLYTSCEHKGKRQIRCNDARLEVPVSMNWITPDMDFITTDSHSAQRNFLDRLTFSFFQNEIIHVSNYEKTKKARMDLLAQNTNIDSDLITTLEHSMSNAGIHYANNRLKLKKILEQHHSNNNLPEIKLTLDGSLEKIILESNYDLHDSTNRYCKMLFESRQMDTMSNRTKFGCHNTKVSFDTTDIHLKSTGQAKMLLFSALLQVALQYEKKPILLFDEMFSHLDKHNSLLIYQAFENFQTWITCTDFQNIPNLNQKIRLLHCKNARIE